MPQLVTMAKRLQAIILSLTLLVTSTSLALAPDAMTSPAGGITLPPGFSDALVTNLASPTALAFTPDGRMLITRQTGTLRVYQNGNLLTPPAIDFASVADWSRSVICPDFERGLLGVAVDPEFTTNHYIYLFYTYRKPSPGDCSDNNPNSPVNRVARFVLPDNNVIVTTTQTVLVDNMPSPNGNHNAGDVNFGNDGYLYISIGDGGCDWAGGACNGSNDGARDQHTLTGKLLRITRDGGIPIDNPFQGANDDRCHVTGSTTPGHRCQETYAWGLRNPFRFAMDPNVVTTHFFINDVGQGAWEEIDLGQAGVDYGWNCREGAHTNNTSGPCNPTPPNMVDPVYEYNHNTGCYSITGGAFVPNGLWPGYDNLYLFSDYGCGSIFALSPSPAYTTTTFATGLGSSSAVHMEFGPYQSTQALYYTTYAGGGQVRRISYSQSPTAVIDATPTNGPAPLLVTFDATGSVDPDGDPLTFDWNFGDGMTATTASITTTYTYTTPGVFTATVVARDPLGLTSAPAAIEIQPGNTPPTPAILAPLTDTLFAVGQVITLTGFATDTQDGPLPASGLRWNVLLHHIDINNPGNSHTHPFVTDEIGNDITFTTPAPEGFDASELSYLEILLTATDSLGLATTITQTLEPNRLNVTFTTIPPGLQLILNSTPYPAPQTYIGWEAWSFAVEAPTQYNGQWWIFESWSDNGASTHTLVLPATDVTYTATFILADELLYLPLISH